MSSVERGIRRIGRSFDRNILRPVYRNVVRPVFRPLERSVLRPVFREVRDWGPDIEKGLRGVAAVAIPVAAGVFGGPLGAAVGLQASAQLPWLRRGWKDVMRETSNATGIDYFRENPYQVAGIGSIALGGYGAANYLSTGSTGWGWGSGTTSLGGTASTATPTAGTTASRGAMIEGTVASPQIASSTVSASQPSMAWQAYLDKGIGAAGINTANIAPTSAGLVNAGYSTATGLAPKLVATGGGSGWGTALGLAGLGSMLGGMFSSPSPPDYTQYVPDYASMIQGAGGISQQDAMGGEYGQQWQQYMDQLSQYTDQMRDLYTEMGSPVQRDYLRMVREGISPDVAANMAGAEVMQGYADAQSMLQRQQAGMGINPSSPLYGAQQADLALQASLGQAQAATQARQQATAANAAMLGQGATYASNMGSMVANMYGNLASQAQGMSGQYTNAMVQNAQIQAQNVAAMNEAVLTYSSQIAQAQIMGANQAYQSRLSQSYGLSNLGGQLFSTWLFGGFGGGSLFA